MTDSQKNKAVFLDRDGTLMEEVHYCRDPEKVRVFPGTPQALRDLQDAGFLLVIITNQSGIERGFLTETDFYAVQAALFRQLIPATIEQSYFCSASTDNPRRKPEIGMVLEAMRDLNLDLSECWFVGDKASDVQCGKNAKVRTIQVQTGYGATQQSPAADFFVKDIVEAAQIILTPRL